MYVAQFFTTPGLDKYLNATTDDLMMYVVDLSGWRHASTKDSNLFFFCDGVL